MPYPIKRKNSSWKGKKTMVIPDSKKKKQGPSGSKVGAPRLYLMDPESTKINEGPLTIPRDLFLIP